MAVVGLGSGTLACNAKDGENWRFFEIDPEIVRLAKDPASFRFLADCAPNAGIVLGDARLTLAKDAHQYDLIVLDAFSSDAIPVHLLTKEAINTYLSKLRRGGSIVMNISNRHIDLGEVVARTAADMGLAAIFRRDPQAGDFDRTFHARATIAVLARENVQLDALAAMPGWSARAADADVRAWTDDYANIVQAIWRKLRG